MALALTALAIVGWQSRWILPANWLALRWVFSLTLDPYTADEAVALMSFVWIFAPAGRRETDTPVPFGFTLAMASALSAIYVDSAVYKLQSPAWIEGTVVWAGASLPLHGWGLLAELDGMAWAWRLAAWISLAYELTFPVILWKPARTVWASIGVALHLISAILLPLPQFGLVMAGSLALFLPWDRWTQGAVGSSSAADRRRGVAAAVLALVIVVCQVAVHFEHRPDPVSRLIGIRPWPIFLSWHFVFPGPVHRFRTEIEDEEVWIPSFDELGYPELRDRYWKVLGWVARSSPHGERMIARYLEGWFMRQGLPPRPVQVYCRDPSVDRLLIDRQLVYAVERRTWVPCGRWAPRSQDLLE